MEIDFDGFVELVDLLGGVEINVDQRMINYDEGINLNPGLQTLNGQQALGYCRFRIGQDGTDSISDIKRAERQQTFIIALKDKLMSLSTLWKVPRLVSLANEYVNTTISVMDAIRLGNTLLQMNLDNINTYTIPTRSIWINSVSYELRQAAAGYDSYFGRNHRRSVRLYAAYQLLMMMVPDGILLLLPKCQLKKNHRI